MFLPSADLKVDRVVTHIMLNKMVDRIANDFLLTELVIVLLCLRHDVDQSWLISNLCCVSNVKDTMAKNDPKWPLKAHIFFSIRRLISLSFPMVESWKPICQDFVLILLESNATLGQIHATFFSKRRHPKLPR